MVVKHNGSLIPIHYVYIIYNCVDVYHIPASVLSFSNWRINMFSILLWQSHSKYFAILLTLLCRFLLLCYAIFRHSSQKLKQLYGMGFSSDTMQFPVFVFCCCCCFVLFCFKNIFISYFITQRIHYLYKVVPKRDNVFGFPNANTFLLFITLINIEGSWHFTQLRLLPRLLKPNNHPPYPLMSRTEEFLVSCFHPACPLSCSLVADSKSVKPGFSYQTVARHTAY